MSTISLYNLLEIAKKKNLEFKNQNVRRLKELNPELHLSRLLESHDFSHQDDDITQFFLDIKKEDFFNDNVMPERWNHKTWSESMRSLHHLFQIDTIKNYLVSAVGEFKFNEVINHCEFNRKKYMNLYRKEIKNGRNIKINTPSPSNASSSLSDESIPNTNVNAHHDNISFINIVKTHISRIIKSKEEDSLLKASLENIIDILDIISE